MRIGRNYFAGIIALILLGIFAYYMQATVSPLLGVFFGFMLGYAIAVLVVFWILGRYGA